MKNKILIFLVLACVLVTSLVVPAFASCTHDGAVYRSGGDDGHRLYCPSCNSYVTDYQSHDSVFVVHSDSRDYLWCTICNLGWNSTDCSCVGSQSTCTHGSYTLYEHYDSVGVSPGTGITGAADYIRCKTCSRDVLIPCVCDGFGGSGDDNTETEPPETEPPETDEPDEPVTPPDEPTYEQYENCPECNGTDVGFEYGDGTHIYFCHDCLTTLWEQEHIAGEYVYSHGMHSCNCTVCGADIDVHEALVGEPVITTPPTCSTPGKGIYYCGDCGKILDVVDIVVDGEGECVCEWVSYGKTQHQYRCKYCFTVQKTENHIFDKFVVIEEATATTPGTYRSTCSACGYYEDTEIPPIDLDNLVKNLTKEQRIQLFKNIFKLYSTELITDKDILKPYVAEFVRTIYTDIAKNGSKSPYYTDYQELYYAILAVSHSNSSDYTQGYNDALSSVVNDNPVQGLFQGMWSGIVHFVSVVGNGIGIGGISLMSVLVTALILLVAFFVVKIIFGG